MAKSFKSLGLIFFKLQKISEIVFFYSHIQHCLQMSLKNFELIKCQRWISSLLYTQYSQLPSNNRTT